MSAIVKLHRNEKSAAISTNAATEDEFVREAITVLADEFGWKDEGVGGPFDADSIKLLRIVVPQIIDIACKLRGYKASVTEHRVLVAGQFVPDDVVEAFSIYASK